MGNNVFIVTGTTSGIGKALALEIAKTGQTLVMIARDVDRGQAATAPEFANTSGKFSTMEKRSKPQRMRMTTQPSKGCGRGTKHSLV